jgi:hypothetical protein
MKMIKPRMNKGVAVAALLSVCVAAWSFNASAALTNLALKKTVVVSSVENNTMPGSNIVDGDTLTRWGSAFSDSQWFYIDFGAVTTFDSIAIWWEHSNALEYNIQTANTATSNDQGWTTISSITNETEVIADNNTLSVHRHVKLATPSNARYLKFRCIKRHYQWGYSMHEVEVYNTQGSVTPGNRVNIALHKIVKADSYAGGNTPEKAVDSICGGHDIGQSSRWESNWQAEPDVDSIRSNAWIYVDLGAKYTVDSVAIYWEHSGAKDYKVQAWPGAGTPTISDNDWTTLLRDTSLTYNADSDMCLSFLKLPPTVTQYVRMHSYKRIFTYGISIIEFKIFGNPVTTIEKNKSIQSNSSGLTLMYLENGVSYKFKGIDRNSFSAEIVSPNGKLIRRLSGPESSFWNFKDDFGRLVTNGTYLLRVTAGGRVIQDKIAIFR